VQKKTFTWKKISKATLFSVASCLLYTHLYAEATGQDWQCGIIGTTYQCMHKDRVTHVATKQTNHPIAAVTNDTADTTVLPTQKQAAAQTPKINPVTLNRVELASYIGWVQTSMPNQICQGYYTEPNLYYKETYAGPKNKSPVTITADKSEFNQTGSSTLLGNVIVTQPERRVESNLVYLNRDPQTEKIATIDAYGNVVLREPGMLAIGDRGHFNLVDKSGQLQDVVYRVSSTGVIEPVDSYGNPTGETVQLHTLNGWGIANTVDRQSTGIIKVYQGTYTACPPTSGGWSLKANHLTLDKNTGRGSATNAFLYLDDFPIFYTPYFNFPIDKRRQTGFLYPTFGNSTNTGIDIGIPFYWNIAPNYDALITPDFQSERGLQLNGVFRYLTSSSTGNFHGSFLPSDNAFSSFQNQTASEILNTTEPPSSLQQAELNRLYNDSDDRYFVSLKDNRHYDPNWSSYLYVNQASDDYYFEDFSGDPAQTTENQIINEGDIYYNSQHWHFTGQMQAYQTLHPVNQSPVENQYKKLPELVLNANYPGINQYWNLGLNSQYDDFAINKNPGDDTIPVEGQRLYLDPKAYYAKYWSWGYVKPQLQVAGRQYDLTHQVPGDKNSITSVLPIFDFDAGLFFDRQDNLFSHSFTQTLEPRLFYLYVPYQNQNDIPLFDTTIEPFSYSQLFQTNRYTGFDRIGDANQVSLGVTTRFINNETGDQKASFSIGQIYYFEKRKVNLDPDTLDLVTLDNEVPSTTYSSPIAGEMDYEVAKHWHLLGDIAWDPNYTETNNANLIFQYKLDPKRVFNAGYTFLRGGDAFIPSDGTTIPSNSNKNNLNQINFSTAWPIVKQWSFVGRYNYNISHNYPQTYYGGLQYDSCCWSARVIAGREFDYLDNNNDPVFDHRIYFQVALKTLGNVGVNDPGNLLTSDIPGYVDDFGHVSSL